MYSMTTLAVIILLADAPHMEILLILFTYYIYIYFFLKKDIDIIDGCKSKKKTRKKRVQSYQKRNALARSRTGGSTMATSNFTAKPLTPSYCLKILLDLLKEKILQIQ